MATNTKTKIPRGKKRATPLGNSKNGKPIGKKKPKSKLALGGQAGKAARAIVAKQKRTKKK